MGGLSLLFRPPEQRLPGTPVVSGGIGAECRWQPAMDLIIEQGLQLGAQGQTLTGAGGGGQTAAVGGEEDAPLRGILRCWDQDAADIPVDQFFADE
jgi:hypothetical protein